MSAGQINNDAKRFKQLRQDLRALMDNPSNYEQVRTTLQNLIIEIENKYSDSDTRRDIISAEKLVVKHALSHLISGVIEKNDPEFTDFITGEIKHQSDIVKGELLREPPEPSSP